MLLQSVIQLAEIPWMEGLTVCAYGISGVFLALALMAAGTRVVSVLVERIESKDKSDKA